MTSQFQLNPRAQAGFSKAGEYDTHRPSYPPAAVTALLRNLNVLSEPSAKIIELGSGTGKFTSLIAEREEGYEVRAVEPHDEMRAELEKKIPEWEARGHGKVTSVKGNAEDIKGVEDETADAVIASQSFHWFANKSALKEIHRVLKVGGVLGLIWNIEDYNAPRDWPCATKWEQVLKTILASIEDGQARFRDMKWKEVFEKQQDSSPLQTLKDIVNHDLPLFSLPLGEETVQWSTWLNDDAIWARYTTYSQIANLRGEEREDVKRRVYEALQGPEVERNEKGEVEVHSRTYVSWTSRV